MFATAYNLLNPSDDLVIFEPDDQTFAGVARAQRYLTGLTAMHPDCDPIDSAAGFWEGKQSVAFIMRAADFNRHKVREFFARERECYLHVMPGGYAQLYYPAKCDAGGLLRMHEIDGLDPEGCTLYGGKIYRAGDGAEDVNDPDALVRSKTHSPGLDRVATRHAAMEALTRMRGKNLVERLGRLCETARDNGVLLGEPVMTSQEFADHMAGPYDLNGWLIAYHAQQINLAGIDHIVLDADDRIKTIVYKAT